MHYSVRLKNISEHDQLVLRLIFSLSEKARGRTHAFALVQSDNETGDICLSQPRSDTYKADCNVADIILLDSATTVTDAPAYQIRKPLIASRVLSVLDRFILERQDQIHAHHAAAPDTSPAGESTAQDASAEIEFCISEEEACELAIVEDETLSNPSNLQTETAAVDTAIAEPSKVTSLLVRHKNRELEVSALAFNSRAHEQPVSRPRALVVDDSPSVRKQIELELDLFNVDVDYAESVSTAEAQLEKQHYDVAFLDVVLPDGDGFGICRAIKAGNRDTRVIMLTGKATAADKIKGTMAGCDAYLVKPVGRITFQNTVCNYLQLREQLEVIHG